EGLLAAGVPISAIGIQSHQHQGYWGKEKIHEVLERFSHFGLPIHFTENTLISGDLMPAYIEDLNDWQVESWPSTPEGEERQMKEVTEMYTELFAHPLVEAITTWDFNDGCWLGAPSGFVKEDNTKKPVFDALKNLIHGEWENHETLTTDENGCVEITGFFGDYQLSSEDGKAQFSLKKDSEEKEILLKLS
ncbi:MAG: endo-1,4-beta-xylanase, partial [Lachnospiraceae bacterium]|nr:endo-1,4-beta-xylanase [Lachnospiraceae bacterium]